MDVFYIYIVYLSSFLFNLSRIIVKSFIIWCWVSEKVWFDFGEWSWWKNEQDLFWGLIMEGKLRHYLCYACWTILVIVLTHCFAFSFWQRAFLRVCCRIREQNIWGLLALCYLHQHKFPQKLNFRVFADSVKIVQPKVAKNGGNPSV